MPYRRLFILVEGQDDKDFFEYVIVPRLHNVFYDEIRVLEYATKDNNYLKRILASISSMGADYWFTHDLDNSPCITNRKESLLQKHPFIQPHKILITTREIESWYAAGHNNDTATRLRVEPLANTTTMTKEEFNRWLPSSCTSRKAFMIELLQQFSIEDAINKNSSFRYCLSKFGIEISDLS
jgi:hypothetical protein